MQIPISTTNSPYNSLNVIKSSSFRSSSSVTTIYSQNYNLRLISSRYMSEILQTGVPSLFSYMLSTIKTLPMLNLINLFLILSFKVTPSNYEFLFLLHLSFFSSFCLQCNIIYYITPPVPTTVSLVTCIFQPNWNYFIIQYP